MLCTISLVVQFSMTAQPLPERQLEYYTTYFFHCQPFFENFFKFFLFSSTGFLYAVSVCPLFGRLTYYTTYFFFCQGIFSKKFKKYRNLFSFAILQVFVDIFSYIWYNKTYIFICCFAEVRFEKNTVNKDFFVNFLTHLLRPPIFLR